MLDGYFDTECRKGLAGVPVRCGFMYPEGAGSVPGGHPDRIRWNAAGEARSVPSFRPHPLAVRPLSLGRADGPVALLARGPSGSALLAAMASSRVTALVV